MPGVRGAMARRKAKKHEEVVRLFAERLRESRRLRGFTQAALAEAAEISVTYISQLERGETAPGIDLVARLAVALGTTAGELLPAAVPPETAEVLREQAERLFDQLRQVGDREAFQVLNPLLALLVESARKRT